MSARLIVLLREYTKLNDSVILALDRALPYITHRGIAACAGHGVGRNGWGERGFALEDMMAYLEIRIAQEVCRVSLDRDRLRVGRLAENDIVLRDAQISRQHAELRFTSGDWRILDLGSTNGLHFKGKRVREHHLTEGDMLLLAPNITLSFHSGPAPTDAISTNAPPTARPIRPPQQAAAALPSATPTGPAKSAAPVGSSIADVLRPRSPFADDEQPYIPPGMGMPAPPTHYSRQYAPRASAFPPTNPPDAVQQSMGEWSSSSSSQFDTLPAGGYPAPAGPLTSGGDGQDPFRRSSVNVRAEVHRATAGPTSTLLHVCQTCGQLTAPDSVYCQSCHHSIAHECTHCRLSLLPIQDRCPRCQSPNPGSVRRAHRAPGA